MATRQVSAVIKRPNGAAWAGGVVRFRLHPDTFRATPAETYPEDVTLVVADDSGNIGATLVSGDGVTYTVTLPSGDTFDIAVPDGSATTLEALRASFSGAPVAINTVEAALLALGVVAVAVHEGGSSVVGDLTVLDFDASDFAVTESPSGEANVGLAYGTGAGTPAEGNHAHADMGLVLLAAQAFSAVSSVSLDSVFTTAFRNYRLLINVDAATAAAQLTMRMRTGAADVSSADYERFVAFGNSDAATLTGVNTAAGTEWNLSSLLNGAVDAGVSIDLFDPQTTRKTRGNLSSVALQTATTVYQVVNGGIGLLITTQCDGFSLIASSGTITGKVFVYGVRGT